MKTITKTYKITSFSPIHIGSINKWRRGLDYESQSDKTIIHNINSIQIPEPESGIYTGTELDSLDSLTQTAQTQHQTLYPQKIFANEISQCSKNAWGNPYIPANSIKGFFNTALIAYKNINLKTLNLDKPFPDLASEYLQDNNIKSIFFPDIEFPSTSLQISDIKMLNLISDQSYGWKKFGHDAKTLPDHKTATSQYVEAIHTGASTIADIRIKIQEDINNTKNQFNEIEGVFNNYSRAVIQKELNFYNQCKMREGYQFYWNLNEKLRKMTSGFIICLGWGVGWQALFSNLHSEKSIGHIRQNYDLGKMNRPCPQCKKPLKTDRFKTDLLFCVSCKTSYPIDKVITQLFPIFPKSRKFVIESGSPMYPLGWLRFEESPPHDKIRDMETYDIIIKPRRKTSKVIRSTFLTPEEYPALKGMTSNFKKKIKIQNRGSFPTEFNMFLNKIAELEFVISISGQDIDPDLDVTRIITTGKPEEATVHFSYSGKGIVLNIKTGAQNEYQRNFVINKFWEIIELVTKNKDE